MKLRKVVVAVSLEEETKKPLMQIKGMDLGADVEIHLVHIVPEIIYARGMHLSVLTYPLEEEKPRISERILAALKDVGNDILPKNTNFICRCLFGANEKAAFTDYVRENGADLVVVATRGKHGLGSFFDSSFAQHQVKYSPANVLILR